MMSSSLHEEGEECSISFSPSFSSFSTPSLQSSFSNSQLHQRHNCNHFSELDELFASTSTEKHVQFVVDLLQLSIQRDISIYFKYLLRLLSTVAPSDAPLRSLIYQVLSYMDCVRYETSWDPGVAKIMLHNVIDDVVLEPICQQNAIQLLRFVPHRHIIDLARKGLMLWLRTEEQVTNMNILTPSGEKNFKKTLNSGFGRDAMSHSPVAEFISSANENVLVSLVDFMSHVVLSPSQWYSDQTVMECCCIHMLETLLKASAAKSKIVINGTFGSIDKIFGKSLLNPQKSPLAANLPFSLFFSFSSYSSNSVCAGLSLFSGLFSDSFASEQGFFPNTDPNPITNPKYEDEGWEYLGGQSCVSLLDWSSFLLEMMLLDLDSIFSAFASRSDLSVGVTTVTMLLLEYQRKILGTPTEEIKKKNGRLKDFCIVEEVVTHLICRSLENSSSPEVIYALSRSLVLLSCSPVALNNSLERSWMAQGITNLLLGLKHQSLTPARKIPIIRTLLGFLPVIYTKYDTKSVTYVSVCVIAASVHLPKNLQREILISVFLFLSSMDFTVFCQWDKFQRNGGVNGETKLTLSCIEEMDDKIEREKEKENEKESEKEKGKEEQSHGKGSRLPVLGISLLMNVGWVKSYLHSLQRFKAGGEGATDEKNSQGFALSFLSAAVIAYFPPQTIDVPLEVQMIALENLFVCLTWVVDSDDCAIPNFLNAMDSFFIQMKTIWEKEKKIKEPNEIFSDFLVSHLQVTWKKLLKPNLESVPTKLSTMAILLRYGPLVNSILSAHNKLEASPRVLSSSTSFSSCLSISEEVLFVSKSLKTDFGFSLSGIRSETSKEGHTTTVHIHHLTNHTFEQLCRVLLLLYMSGFNEADSWVLSLDQLFSFGPTYHKQTCGLLKNLLHSLKKNVSFDAGRAISEEEIFIIDAQPSSPTFSFSSLGAAVPVVTISDSNPKEKEKEKEKEKTFNPLKSVKSKKEKRKSTHKDLRASIIKSDTEVPFVEEVERKRKKTTEGPKQQDHLSPESNMGHSLSFRWFEAIFNSLWGRIPSHVPYLSLRISEKVNSYPVVSKFENPFLFGLTYKGTVLSGGSDPLLVQIAHIIDPLDKKAKFLVSVTNRTPFDLPFLRLAVTPSASFASSGECTQTIELSLLFEETKIVSFVWPIHKAYSLSVSVSLFISTLPGTSRKGEKKVQSTKAPPETKEEEIIESSEPGVFEMEGAESHADGSSTSLAGNIAIHDPVVSIVGAESTTNLGLGGNPATQSSSSSLSTSPLSSSSASPPPFTSFSSSSFGTANFEQSSAPAERKNSSPSLSRGSKEAAPSPSSSSPPPVPMKETENKQQRQQNSREKGEGETPSLAFPTEESSSDGGKGGFDSFLLTPLSGPSLSPESASLHCQAYKVDDEVLYSPGKLSTTELTTICFSHSPFSFSFPLCEQLDDVPTFFQEKLKELGCFAPSYHSSFQLDLRVYCPNEMILSSLSLWALSSVSRFGDVIVLTIVLSQLDFPSLSGRERGRRGEKEEESKWFGSIFLRCLDENILDSWKHRLSSWANTMVNCLNTNDTEVECDFHGLSFQKPQYQQHGQGHSLHHRKEKEKRARGKNKKEKNESEIEVDFSSLAKRLQGTSLVFCGVEDPAMMKSHLESVLSKSLSLPFDMDEMAF